SQGKILAKAMKVIDTRLEFLLQVCQPAEGDSLDVGKASFKIQIDQPLAVSGKLIFQFFVRALLSSSDRLLNLAFNGVVALATGWGLVVFAAFPSLLRQANIIGQPVSIQVRKG